MFFKGYEASWANFDGHQPMKKAARDRSLAAQLQDAFEKASLGKNFRLNVVGNRTLGKSNNHRRTYLKNSKQLQLLLPAGGNATLGPALYVATNSHRT